MTAKEIIKQIVCAEHTINTKPECVNFVFVSVSNTLTIGVKKREGNCFRMHIYFRFDENFQERHVDCVAPIMYFSRSDEQLIINYCRELMKYHLKNSIDFSEITIPENYTFVINIYL